MDTYLGLCPGHCTGDPEKIQLYLERLEQAREFLRGKHELVLEGLRHAMQESAQKHEFEQAQEYKGMIEQIEATGNRQIVRDVIEGDALVTVGLEKYGQVFLSVVEVRNSMTVGVHEYRLENPLNETTDDILAHAVLQYMGEHIVLSKKKQTVLFTDIALEPCEDFSDFILSQKVVVKHPVRGEKVRLLEFAHTNLLNFAYRETMEGFKKATLGKKDMLLLIEKLFPESTKHKAQSTKKEIIFECFDISHSHGEHTVASKSVLVNGKPDPKRYKKYRIKTLKTGMIDDFASMEEILTRRTLAALRGEDAWPDMIIIDGGKGQLSHAVQAIQNTKDKVQNEKDDSVILGLDPSIQDKQTMPFIISLAKREEEVFLAGQSESILLEKGSSGLMLLQKVRDEAHRFAINYNRASREKSYTKTIFDELPGIGPVARKKILSYVSRIEELQDWSLEKAEQAFGKKTAAILQDHGILQG